MCAWDKRNGHQTAGEHLLGVNFISSFWQCHNLTISQCDKHLLRVISLPIQTKTKKNYLYNCLLSINAGYNRLFSSWWFINGTLRPHDRDNDNDDVSRKIISAALPSFLSPSTHNPLASIISITSPLACIISKHYFRRQAFYKEDGDTTDSSLLEEDSTKASPRGQVNTLLQNMLSGTNQWLLVDRCAFYLRKHQPAQTAMEVANQ